MSLITTPTALMPHQLRQYLVKLDELGVVYHFTITRSDAHSRLTLELVADSGDTGVSVTLHPGGSWTAEGTLIVGTRD